MTEPERSDAAPPPVRHPRATNVLLGKQLTVLRAAQIIAFVTLSVTVVAGVLMRFTDPKKFPNIGDGCGGRSRPSRRSATATSFQRARPAVC